MLLDIVLDRPEVNWLGTERDKVTHCRYRLNVPAEDLPSLVFEQGGSRTVRHFPDKLPIGIGKGLDELLFVYLVTDPHPDSVRRFMQRHRPLFRRVHQWTLGLFFPGYLASAESRIRAAVMESFAEPVGLSALEEFKWFCSARVGAERGFPPTDHVRYTRACRAFGSPRFYAAYRSWRRDPSTGFFDLSSIGLRDKLQCGLIRIETHVLTHRHLNVGTTAITA